MKKNIDFYKSRQISKTIIKAIFDAIFIMYVKWGVLPTGIVYSSDCSMICSYDECSIEIFDDGECLFTKVVGDNEHNVEIEKGDKEGLLKALNEIGEYLYGSTEEEKDE